MTSRNTPIAYSTDLTSNRVQRHKDKDNFIIWPCPICHSSASMVVWKRKKELKSIKPEDVL